MACVQWSCVFCLNAMWTRAALHLQLGLLWNQAAGSSEGIRQEVRGGILAYHSSLSHCFFYFMLLNVWGFCESSVCVCPCKQEKKNNKNEGSETGTTATCHHVEQHSHSLNMNYVVSTVCDSFDMPHLNQSNEGQTLFCSLVQGDDSCLMTDSSKCSL